jgi:hypothetical protein
MKKIYLAFALTTYIANPLSAQELGWFDFETNGISCPHNLATTVITQPLNALFSPFISIGTSCSQSNYQFNNSSWETSSTINTAEYNEFTLTADLYYFANLSSISFGHRTNSTTFCTYHLRSSLDNYATDIATGQTTDTWDYPLITLSGFTNLTSVTFRFYVTDIESASSTWRQDDVIVNGTINASGAGIDELNNRIALYPNPGDELITFELMEGVEIISLSVHHINGQLIENTKQIGLKSYDVSKLVSGNYIFSIQTAEGTFFHHWVKK